MMKSYFYAFLKNNKVKVSLLILSLSVYFSLAAISFTLNGSIAEIAEIPLKSIGVQTIVQKEGKIPEKMTGAIFPHSNAPVSAGEFELLKGLEFVEASDKGLYFWYFDRSFFKAVLGIERGSGIFSNILKRNIKIGSFGAGRKDILITEGFALKNNIALGSKIEISGREYTVKGILNSGMSGNIIPADIYMDMDDALTIVKDSDEMKRLYHFTDEGFSNVVLLRTDPGWKGGKEEAIKKIDKKFLVFSEKTFTREILEQLQLISSSGRMMFITLGVVLAAAFGILIMFNLKTREKEIAVLRMIGWKISDLKKQFIGESFIILAASLVIGNVLAFFGLDVLSRQTISMELPWDISARPHFLTEENSIERVVTSTIPVHFDAATDLVISLSFLLIFLTISLIAFTRIKNIKPFEYRG